MIMLQLLYAKNDTLNTRKQKAHAPSQQIIL